MTLTTECVYTRTSVTANGGLASDRLFDFGGLPDYDDDAQREAENERLVEQQKTVVDGVLTAVAPCARYLVSTSEIICCLAHAGAIGDALDEIADEIDAFWESPEGVAFIDA